MNRQDGVIGLDDCKFVDTEKKKMIRKDEAKVPALLVLCCTLIFAANHTGTSPLAFLLIDRVIFASLKCEPR